MSVIDKFQKEKYVLLRGFLHEDSCKQLTDELWRVAKNAETQKDAQCPLSEAIHGNPTFDSLLEQLLPHFETATGKKLLPTYSYARLYRPGEELTVHVDRPACEISATLTVGMFGNPWPIYMGENRDKSGGEEILMQVGDAVVYMGMDKWHWREKYTQGEWQAQIFLHYVDAEGKYKDQVFDGRKSLGVPKNTVAASDPIRWVSYKDILTHSACDSLVKTYTQDFIEKQEPYIGSGTGIIDRNIRNVQRVILPTYKDLGGRLAAAGLNANKIAWNFDVSHAPQAEFLSYPEGGKYEAHVDTFLMPNTECRKITTLAFLNDDFEGGRFYLQDGHERIYPPQEKGFVISFPSFLLHGVEPVTKGTRYSAVCWLAGEFFK